MKTRLDLTDPLASRFDVQKMTGSNPGLREDADGSGPYLVSSRRRKSSTMALSCAITWLGPLSSRSGAQSLPPASILQQIEFATPRVEWPVILEATTRACKDRS